MYMYIIYIKEFLFYNPKVPVRPYTECLTEDSWRIGQTVSDGKTGRATSFMETREDFAAIL